MSNTLGHEARQAMDEFEAKALLKQHGVDVVDERLVQTEAEALKAAHDLGYPVVLKGCSSRILHKTDAGIVEVGLTDDDRLTKAYQRISSKVADLEGFVVQRMIPGKREFLVGMTRDPVFGPCVVFGLGGIFTEAFKDVTYRVAPFDPQEAERMCQEIRSHKLLGPFRGLGPVNLSALASLIAAVGAFAEARPDVAEIDLNPVMPYQDRVVAVDAMIVFR